MRTTRAVLGLAFIALFAAGFLFGGGYLIYWQKTGEPTLATVTECFGRARSRVCKGTWFAGGAVHIGTIENANVSDLGKRIEVRAHPGSDRAIKPGLRLPIVLFSLGLGIAVLGAIWWVREAPRAESA